VAGVKKEARDKAVAEKKRREDVQARREVNRKKSQVVQKARAARARRACTRVLDGDCGSSFPPRAGS
jgi:uncharacterized membrane protein